MEGLSELINVRFLLSQLVNFVILFVALYFLLWKRALKAFDERKARIAQGLDDAEKAQQKLAEAEREYARQVEGAQREREQILAKAREDAEAAKEQIVAGANTERRRIISNAEEEVEQERQEMLEGLRDQVAALAVAAANRIIGEALDEERQRRLIDEFFSGVAAGRVQVVEEGELAWDQTGAPSTVSVISALPLSPEEKATVVEELTSQLGAVAEFEFSVEPAILGGLKIELGDRVIDGSVAGKLEALQERLT